MQINDVCSKVRYANGVIYILCLLHFEIHWYPVQVMIHHQIDKPNVSRMGKLLNDGQSFNLNSCCEERCSAGMAC